VFLKISKMAVFVLLASSLTWAARPQTVTTTCAAWQDTFQTLDLNRWTVANGSAPGSSSVNVATFDPNNVAVVKPGVLRLTLTQVATTINGTPGVTSYGGSLRTKQVCGYGTYTWKMKMSSTALCEDSSCAGQPVSGSVSAGFIYVNNSQTEIDFEFQGQNPGDIYLVNWLNPKPQRDPSSRYETSTAYASNPIDGQHTYQFVWQRGRIDYYVDGVLAATHTTNVPSAAAYFIMNHWGTNSTNWGGTATTSTARYMYVTYASYAP
jgi:beta-glucanase (GH16 family)